MLDSSVILIYLIIEYKLTSIVYNLFTRFHAWLFGIFDLSYYRMTPKKTSKVSKRSSEMAIGILVIQYHCKKTLLISFTVYFDTKTHDTAYLQNEN